MITKHKWGGNYNCVNCFQYDRDGSGQHKCKKYHTPLKRGRVPGLWILPCLRCHAEKNYGNRNGLSEARINMLMDCHNTHAADKLIYEMSATEKEQALQLLIHKAATFRITTIQSVIKNKLKAELC